MCLKWLNFDQPWLSDFNRKSSKMLFHKKKIISEQWESPCKPLQVTWSMFVFALLAYLCDFHLCLCFTPLTTSHKSHCTPSQSGRASVCVKTDMIWCSRGGRRVVFAVGIELQWLSELVSSFLCRCETSLPECLQLKCSYPNICISMCFSSIWD